MKAERCPILILFISLLVVLGGCGTVPTRNPLPEKYGDSAEIPGIPQARFWGDTAPSFYNAIADQPRDKLVQQFSGVFGIEHHYLALSGGGANGAFGAGLMVGWSAAGTRPDFPIVTGISTGAIMAPFVFLGSAYDVQLKEMFTQYSTKDLIVKHNILTALTGSSAASTAPLRKMLAKYLDRSVMEIGRAHV